MAFCGRPASIVAQHFRFEDGPNIQRPRRARVHDHNETEHGPCVLKPGHRGPCMPELKHAKLKIYHGHR